MQVILLESLTKLGKAGEIVSVKDGFAKNYLIPHNKAIVANKANLSDLDQRLSKINANNKKKLEEASLIKQKINENEYKIEMEANDEGNLYGAITHHQIINAISVDTNLINGDTIILPQIKSLGNYPVKIRLYEDVIASIIISVVKK